jgi:mycoredoxin
MDAAGVTPEAAGGTPTGDGGGTPPGNEGPPVRVLPSTGFSELSEESEDMQGTVTMYSTTWCGYCRRLKSQLDREGIAYSEINIEQDPESAAFVEKANGGNQTVPTVLFEDGTTLTNPSLAQVKQKLAA